MADTVAWAWGSGTFGQLGNNDVTTAGSPVAVVGAHSFASLGGGSNHSLGLKSNDGSAWAWGLNSSGQLGIGVFPSVSSPVLVVGSQRFKFAITGQGASHSLALASDLSSMAFTRPLRTWRTQI